MQPLNDANLAVMLESIIKGGKNSPAVGDLSVMGVVLHQLDELRPAGMGEKPPEEYHIVAVVLSENLKLRSPHYPNIEVLSHPGVPI